MNKFKKWLLMSAGVLILGQQPAKADTPRPLLVGNLTDIVNDEATVTRSFESVQKLGHIHTLTYTHDIDTNAGVNRVYHMNDTFDVRVFLPTNATMETRMEFIYKDVDTGAETITDEVRLTQTNPIIDGLQREVFFHYYNQFGMDRAANAFEDAFERVYSDYLQGKNIHFISIPNEAQEHERYGVLSGVRLTFDVNTENLNGLDEMFVLGNFGYTDFQRGRRNIITELNPHFLQATPVGQRLDDVRILESSRTAGAYSAHIGLYEFNFRINNGSVIPTTDYTMTILPNGNYETTTAQEGVMLEQEAVSNGFNNIQVYRNRNGRTMDVTGGYYDVVIPEDIRQQIVDDTYRSYRAEVASAH